MAAPNRLTEIRARLEAATTTGWYDPQSVEALTPWRGAAAAMVAHAPSDIAWLLEEVERARASETVAWEICERAQEILDAGDDDDDT